MKDKMVYCLFILIGVILITWGCIVLATPPKVAPKVQEDVLIQATKTFNLSDMHELAMYYGKMGR